MTRQKKILPKQRYWPLRFTPKMPYTQFLKLRLLEDFEALRVIPFNEHMGYIRHMIKGGYLVQRRGLRSAPNSARNVLELTHKGLVAMESVKSTGHLPISENNKPQVKYLGNHNK